MAHRGPLREVFGLLCMAPIFPKSEKKTTPMSNTGYIIDHDDGDNFNTHRVVTASQSSGFRPLILSFLIAVIFDIAELMTEMAFDWALDHGFSLILAVIERAFSRAVTFAARLLQASNPRRRAVVGEAPEQTTQPQPAPEELATNTSTSESNAQALTDL